MCWRVSWCYCFIWKRRVWYKTRAIKNIIIDVSALVYLKTNECRCIKTFAKSLPIFFVIYANYMLVVTDLGGVKPDLIG